MKSDVACDVCSKNFIKRHNMLAHRRTYHGNHTFACHCGYTSHHSKNFRQHQKKCKFSSRSKRSESKLIVANPAKIPTETDAVRAYFENFCAELANFIILPSIMSNSPTTVVVEETPNENSNDYVDLGSVLQLSDFVTKQLVHLDFILNAWCPETVVNNIVSVEVEEIR